MNENSADPDYANEQTLRTTKLESSGRNERGNAQTQPLQNEDDDSYSDDDRQDQQTEERFVRTTDEHPVTTQYTYE